MDTNSFLQKFSQFFDLKHRTLSLNGKNVDVFFLDTMCSSDKVTQFVVRPLIEMKEPLSAESLVEKIIFGADCKTESDFDKVCDEFLDGKTIVFVEKENDAVIVDTKTIEYRAVAEPPTSRSTKGPREGFNENIKTNLTLLRKRLKTENFKADSFTVGDKTNTMVAVCYIKGTASDKIVKSITEKIKTIKTDGVLDSSFVAVYLDADKTTLFKLVGSFEKPDVVASKLLEGKVAVIVDGSPISALHFFGGRSVTRRLLLLHTLHGFARKGVEAYFNDYRRAFACGVRCFAAFSLSDFAKQIFDYRIVVGAGHSFHPFGGNDCCHNFV